MINNKNYKSDKHEKFELIPKNYSLDVYNYSDSYLGKYSDLIGEYDKEYFGDQIVIGIFLNGNYSSYPPTAYIRIIIPFYHIFETKNIKPYVFCPKDHDKFKNEPLFSDKKVFDVIVVQRDCLDKDTADFIIDICNKFDTKLIYEIDDDLINIDKNHPEYDSYIVKKEIIEFLVSNADSVTVSTEALKNKLLDLNQNCFVIPNSLNNLLKTDFTPKKLSDKIKIGYMGSFTHVNDLNLIKNVVMDVKKYFKDSPNEVIFEMIGGCKGSIEGIERINIPKNTFEYPRFMSWIKNNIDWDIGIAPLQNNNINNSKSEIKYLEYSSWGLAGVYSDVGPYSRVVDSHDNGILIKNNSHDEWVNAIIELIENDELYNKIRRNAFEFVNEHYSLENFIELWIAQISNLLSSNKQAIFNRHNKYQLFLNPQLKKDYEKIKNSNIFDEKYYLDNYSDVKNEKADPIYHYLIKGSLNDYNPSRKFNTKKYIKNNNIDINNVNPLIQFLKNNSKKKNNDYKSKLKSHKSLKPFIKGYRFFKNKVHYKK